MPTFHFKASDIPNCSHKNYPNVYLSCASEKKKGSSLPSRKPFAFQPKTSILDTEGRYLIVTCKINAQPYTIRALHAPNSHQLRFLCKLFKCISTVKQGPLLMCGDFNLMANPHLDSSAKKHTLSLQHLFHTEELYDVWHCQHGNERVYIFFSPRY